MAQANTYGAIRHRLIPTPHNSLLETTKYGSKICQTPKQFRSISDTANTDIDNATFMEHGLRITNTR